MAKEVDLKVPLGNSLISEFVHVEFQKTQDGWRISSEPGTFYNKINNSRHQRLLFILFFGGFLYYKQ